MDMMACDTAECKAFGESSVARAAYYCYKRANLDEYGQVHPEAWEACRVIMMNWKRSGEGRMAVEPVDDPELNFVNGIARTLR